MWRMGMRTCCYRGNMNRLSKKALLVPAGGSSVLFPVALVAAVSVALRLRIVALLARGTLPRYMCEKGS